MQSPSLNGISFTRKFPPVKTAEGDMMFAAIKICHDSHQYVSLQYAIMSPVLQEHTEEFRADRSNWLRKRRRQWT